jgi:hypothetical protein
LQTKAELSYILGAEVYNAIAPWLVLYGQGFINRQYGPEALYSAAGITITNNKEYASSSDGEGGYNYPSGRFVVKLSYNKGVSLNKQFLLIRGHDTFQPFFIVNDQFF